ncbi:hypothetical protein [Achromobacter phage kwar_LB4]|nr:hypothetical protein [Achromobacter phage kwar_LB4]
MASRTRSRASSEMTESSGCSAASQDKPGRFP